MTPTRSTAWAELLRVSALFTVVGDAVAGAASAGARPNRGTALAVGASVCLYEAGMALNDWADRAEDAVDRPHRPIPSGRVTPRAALAASCALTAAGLALAAGAGRPALGVAVPLAATVWAYDLRLKHTPAAPAAMATARALDLLLGATATRANGPGPAGTGSRGAARFGPRPGNPARRGGPSPAPEAPGEPAGRGPVRSPGAGSGLRRARPGPAGGAARDFGARDTLTAAAMLGAHTYAVTAVSRRETRGGSTAAPLAALAATAVLAALAARERPGATSRAPYAHAAASRHGAVRLATRLASPAALAAAAYFRTAAKPLLHAALNPSPPLTQRAVGGGIRAMIPLQAALAARSGAAGAGAGAALMGLVPVARKLSRKVSPT
ncbi:SCO3242 family prenyltransferase [Streptomyces sp. Wb2n-11]|uniref:SCO3242 family prenyltransferase n=1 Tax=Streptomyces sp. Wb2n-11 TaxID=1030533 RepID=UPI000B2571C4|nr:UbiA family prenyltransferase [Streptomyces sp. Wb2n-11]